MTGTNGKTTTVELIGHIHREAGLPVAVAGNVGTAVSSLVGCGRSPGRTIVCEASSFQLEDTLRVRARGGGAAEHHARPPRPPRHVRGLPAGEAADLRASGRRRRGGAADASSAGRGSRRRRAARALRRRCGRRPRCPSATGQLWWQEQRAARASTSCACAGAHNVENAMAAAAVCLARGVEPDAVRAGPALVRGRRPPPGGGRDAATACCTSTTPRRRTSRARSSRSTRSRRRPDPPDPRRPGQGPGLHARCATPVRAQLRRRCI